MEKQMNDELEKMVDDLCDTHGDSRVIAVNGRIMEMLEKAYEMGRRNASHMTTKQFIQQLSNSNPNM